ncbi:hypothetical protein Sxan_48400 [Streptomyces xanthophaeus]|uniref:Uncharacterized protein n=1 Tax=Streptomyces xanthophaeus TaxID=67385 RepID=A0A919H3E5_9ACTN|nr:hypothetical protein Sxan_48400 [Streptomyces xanthophaeus]
MAPMSPTSTQVAMDLAEGESGVVPGLAASRSVPVASGSGMALVPSSIICVERRNLRGVTR